MQQQASISQTEANEVEEKWDVIIKGKLTVPRKEFNDFIGQQRMACLNITRMKDVMLEELQVLLI